MRATFVPWHFGAREYLPIYIGFISPSIRLGEEGIVITCTTLLLSSAFMGVGISP
jgi:hypothetical protein